MHHGNDEYVDDINITLDHSEKMQFITTWEFLRKGSRPRGAGIRCYLKGLFEPQHHHRIYMNKIKQF